MACAFSLVVCFRAFESWSKDVVDKGFHVVAVEDLFLAIQNQPTEFRESGQAICKK